MSIKILQIEDATFKKLAWWSNWIDFAVFDHSSQPYLVQMSLSRRNKKKFRCIKVTGKPWQLRFTTWTDLKNSIER